MINQSGQIGDSFAAAGPDGVLDGIEHELGVHAGCRAPADDAS